VCVIPRICLSCEDSGVVRIETQSVSVTDVIQGAQTSRWFYMFLLYPRRQHSRDRVFTFIDLCVCLFFHTICKETSAARITKLDTEMFHDESWENHLFWCQRLRPQGTKNCRRRSLHSSECWLILLLSLRLLYTLVIVGLGLVCWHGGNL